MEGKFSLKTQKEVEQVLVRIDNWKHFFTIKLNYFHEGWALYLREKNLFPRLIVIFKSYNKDFFTLKSFEINVDMDKNESYEELYLIEGITDLNSLEKELKDVIYGKDLVKSSLKILKEGG